MELHIPVNLEETILLVIENDLIHTRLINGLIDMSLKPTDYFLSLDEVVFALMGCENDGTTEVLKEWYFTQTDKVSLLDSPSRDEFTWLAQEIYLNLKVQLQQVNREA